MTLCNITEELMRILSCGSSPTRWIFFPEGSHWSQAECGQSRLTVQHIAWGETISHSEQEHFFLCLIIIWECSTKNAAVSLHWCYLKPFWLRGFFHRKMQSHLMQMLLQESVVQLSFFNRKKSWSNCFWLCFFAVLTELSRMHIKTN